MRFKYKNTQSLTARVALLAMFFFKTVILTAQPIQFIDSQTQKPISFATVSFGNGLGSYANADGIFNFNSKRLSAIDTLFVSAMGYNQIIIETKNLKASYLLTPTADELDEVLVVAQRRGRFRRRQLRPVTHQEYHNSWLQTLESEIAVKFEPFQEKPTQITAILLPVNIREEVAGKTFPARPFSTMMRIKFYENNQGLPGNEIAYDNIVFIITEKHQNNVFEVDISQQSVFIPKDGIFIAVQVLGPTDRQGNLAETRIYNEFETERGTEKIALSFRPLLPMTNQITNKNTFVRRIFLNNQQWQEFDFTYNPNSDLLRRGYNNYGMGIKMHVFNE